jgi:DNA-binding NarL/FixJ family response regulator
METKGRMIRIAIAEDITRIAETLKEKVELAPDFKVQFIASNGKEMIQMLQKNHNIDVILMDINMPEQNGIETTKQVVNRWPNIKIVMSTVFDDEHYIFDAIIAGASGYLMKDEPPAKIHRSIYEALEGGAPMSPAIARKSLEIMRKGKPSEGRIPSEEYNLTNRETEMLEHLAKGLSYEQIADNLFISYGTVRKHIENVYKKLKVHNKVEAVQKAQGEGLI